MTKTDIKEQLAAKELALKALLKENNLSIKTALTAEELAVLEQTYLLLGLAEAPQDIGKKTFIDYVQDWVKDFISILDEEKRTDIQIDVADIITSLQTEIQKPDFPISMILWKNLKAEISKLASPTTAEGLRKALLNGFNTFNTEIGTKFLLTKHFKENRTTYNKIKKKNLNEQVMIANNFHIWLEKVLEKAEKEQARLEERKEDLRREYQQNVVDYTVLFGASINSIKINNPQSLSDTVNVDMKLLFNNLSTALDDDGCRHAPISKDLWGFVKNNLSSNPYYEIEEVRSQFNRWCRSLSSKSPWYEEQFEFWIESKEGFPNPSLIAGAVNDAYIDIDADTIKQHLIEWTSSVKDAFVMPKNYTIVIEKAKTNFKELFDEESNKGISTLFFYDDILEVLFQQNGETAQLEELKNTVWEKAMKQVVEKQRIANYFGEWRESYGPYAVKSFNEELDTLLPTTKEIQQALLKSIERKRKLIIPEIEVDSLKMDFVIRSTKLDKYSSRKKIIVDLTYENYPISKEGALTDILTVIPTNIDVRNGNNEESKSEIQLVRSKIGKPTFFGNGSSMTIVKLTFMAVTDVEKLFNNIDMKNLDYKGHNLSSLLKKINFGVAKKGAGAMMSVEDFVYKSTNVEYFDVEFSLKSVLADGNNKIIELQTGITSNSEFDVKFGDGSKYLTGKTFLRPTYDYK